MAVSNQKAPTQVFAPSLKATAHRPFSPPFQMGSRRGGRTYGGAQDVAACLLGEMWESLALPTPSAAVRAVRAPSLPGSSGEAGRERVKRRLLASPVV